MELRPELPRPVPPQVVRLPRDRGYPVPWFVAWVDGKPDFRVVDTPKIEKAMHQGRCWICGQFILGLRAFVVGPMCAINRISAEPPSHTRCASWAAQACPFLVRPHARRREGGLEDHDEPAGTMIRRNPGVALVWVTSLTVVTPVDNGLLFDIGTPSRVEWWCEGRRATTAEIMESIDSGLPLLWAEAEKDGPEAVDELKSMYERALRYVPAAA
jgi:hypothetical protein